MQDAGFDLDCQSLSAPVGTKRTVSAAMRAKSAAAPTIASSNETVASGSLSGAETENGYLFEIRFHAVGTAVVTISDGTAARSVPVTVTGRNPPVLDTARYTTAAGDTYYFLASTGADDLSDPAAVSADPGIAEVEFCKKIGTGQYLFRVSARRSGTTTVGAAICGTESDFPISVVSTANIPFSPLLQQPELLSGCEITALTNLLNHDGYGVSKTYMADSMLSKDASQVYQNGKLYMADPAKVFVGDPRMSWFGCYAQPIADAANRYLKSMDSGLTAENISGSAPSGLYHLVANHIPVLAWATIGMSEPTYNSRWYDKATGKPIAWIGGEHCVVLTGFSDTSVTVSDPLSGIRSYSRSLFEQRYSQVGRQAVVLR